MKRAIGILGLSALLFATPACNFQIRSPLSQIEKVDEEGNFYPTDYSGTKIDKQHNGTGYWIGEIEELVMKSMKYSDELAQWEGGARKKDPQNLPNLSRVEREYMEIAISGGDGKITRQEAEEFYNDLWQDYRNKKYLDILEKADIIPKRKVPTPSVPDLDEEEYIRANSQ